MTENLFQKCISKYLAKIEADTQPTSPRSTQQFSSSLFKNLPRYNRDAISIIYHFSLRKQQKDSS